MRPASAVVRLLDGTRNSSGFTVSMEANTLSFFCFAKATTVTSSSSSVFSFIVTLIVVWLPTSTIWLSRPIKEYTSLSVDATSIE